MKDRTDFERTSILPRWGAHLKIVVQPNIREMNSLWQDDRIYLQVDDDPAAHLTISMIPSHKFDAKFSRGILDYLIYQANFHRLNVPDNDLKQALTGFLGLPPDASGQRIKNRLEADWGYKWKTFRAFHRENPWVAMVRVYNHWDQTVPNPDCRDEEDFARAEPIKNYRKLGLSTVIYQQAALYLAQQGKLLAADDCQTQEAQSTWRTLETTFPEAISQAHQAVGDTSPPRLALDGSCFTKTWIPSWAGSIETPFKLQEREISPALVV